MTHKQHRRIRWRVRPCRGGWLPIVLIGEEPYTMPCQVSKREARRLARNRAEVLRGASI